MFNMKHPFSQIVGLSMLAMAAFFTGCEEVPPFIDYSKKVVLAKDTTYFIDVLPAAENKNVLIEDLSGVRCVNCPDANVTAKNIQAKNPDRVVVLTLFPTSLKNFTTPYVGEDTLVTQDAENIMTQILKTPTGLPSGAVDRIKYSAEPSITMRETKWEKYTNDQLLLKSKVNTPLELAKDESQRKMVANVKAVFTESFSHPVYMTLMLVESEIESKQDTKGGEVEDYVHHHVLRKCITPYNGIQLAATIEKGRVFEKGFEIEIPEKYKFSKCSVVAIINLNEADNKEVLQSVEA
jgi:hypothetical protein